eukprot:Amastigsp_a342408_8.p1 type:complete len:265 gc:universal Amastigsp_a342408_8:1-795(+)
MGLFTMVTVLLISSAGALMVYSTYFKSVKTSSIQEKEEPFDKNLTDEHIAELKSVFEKISQSSNLYLEGKYQLIESSTGKKLEEEPFILAKTKDKTYMMTGFIEQLSEKNNTVIINNQDKTILAQSTRQYGDKQQPIAFDALLNLKDYLKVFDSTKVYINETNGLKTLRILINDPESLYKESEAVYDANSFELKSTSVKTKIIDNNNNEQIEKEVLLKLIITVFNEVKTDERPVLLNAKINWKKNKLFVVDSLKSYSINYSLNK